MVTKTYYASSSLIIGWAAIFLYKTSIPVLFRPYM